LCWINDSQPIPRIEFLVACRSDPRRSSVQFRTSQCFAGSYTWRLTAPVTLRGDSSPAILSRSLDTSMCRADGPIRTSAANCLCSNSISHWQSRVSTRWKNGSSAREMRSSLLHRCPASRWNDAIPACGVAPEMPRLVALRFKIRKSSEAGRGVNTFKADRHTQI
jgi:hypothetical protein